MKEAVGGVSMFQIVILFILLFTAIMCLTINNANAFQMKDEITNIIELNNGNILDAKGNLNAEMQNALVSSSYRTRGHCDEGYIGYDLDGTKVDAGRLASICIKCVNVTNDVHSYLTKDLDPNNEGLVATQGHKIYGYYYQVVVFYQLDIPVVGQAYDFKTKGETKTIYNNAAYCKQEKVS